MTHAHPAYADVTIVVSPRERFSFARESLENVYQTTPGLTNLIYVDGGSPKAVQRYLERESDARGFQLIRTERFLSPNQARNIGFCAVTTKYVAFLDNDVLLEPGWLDALIVCAEETGAAAVGPLYAIEREGSRRIHMAGGTARIVDENGKRSCEQLHFRVNDPVPADGTLERRECSLVEFHAMLVQTKVFADAGPLDEHLYSLDEHTDFCLNVQALGGTIFFEPAAQVTYVVATRLRPSDLPFYFLRWSERWNYATGSHFGKKWRLDAAAEETQQTVLYGRHYRLRGLGLVRNHGGGPSWVWASERIVSLVERVFNAAFTSVLDLTMRT